MILIIKKACNRSRTGDLLLTRQVLYQLSYTGYPTIEQQPNTNYLYIHLDISYTLIFY